MKKMNSAGNAVSRRTWLISLSVTLGIIILIELLKKLNSIIGFTGIVLQGMSGPSTMNRLNSLVWSRTARTICLPSSTSSWTSPMPKGI